MRTVNIKSQKTISLSSIRDLFEISDEWELCAWPISYNESVSFIFRNAAEGDVLDNTSEKDYHFKVFTISNFDFNATQKKDITLHDQALVSISFWENGYALTARDRDDCCTVLFYDQKEKHTSDIALGPNVTRLMLAKDGRIAFGYAGTFPEKLPCFVILSPLGKKLYSCEEATARACIDLTIDRNDNIWVSCYPDVSTYEVKKDGTVEKHQYPIASPSGLIPFDVNGKTAIIFSYTDDDVYTPVNYLYLNGELLELTFDDLGPHEVCGISSYAGLAILLTNDDKLHFFNLDDIAKKLN